MIFHKSNISTIQSPNLFLLVGFLGRLLGNRVWPVRGVRSRCNTPESKRCYGNSNVKVGLYSLLFELFCMYHITVSEKKPTDPEL